jgi:hypothetical protein
MNPVDGLGHLCLDFNSERYRVMENDYRAYTGVKEFTREACDHKCMLIREPIKGHILVPSIITDDFVQCGERRILYNILVEHYVWYDDGTPVGMKL